MPVALLDKRISSWIHPDRGVQKSPPPRRNPALHPQETSTGGSRSGSALSCREVTPLGYRSDVCSRTWPVIMIYPQLSPESHRHHPPHKAMKRDRNKRHNATNERPAKRPPPQAEPNITWTHAMLSWNKAHAEWFCVKCGRTSHHVTVEDAQTELAQYECRLPFVEYSEKPE